MCNVICAENTQLSHTENIKLSEHLNLASLTAIKFSLCQAGLGRESLLAGSQKFLKYFIILSPHVTCQAPLNIRPTGYK